MKLHQSPVLLLTVICVSVFTVLTAHAESLAVSQQEQDLLGIEVQTVNAKEQGSAGEITMRVAFAADAEWAIKTPMPGVLHRVFVQQGDRVKQGDPLVVVRSPAMVDLQRDYLKARAELNLQVSNWNRDQKLHEAGSISERRWQETRYNHDTARAEFAGLRGQLKLAGFADKDLQQLTDKMEIGPDIMLRAPADAIVLARPAMLGDQLDGSELLVSLGETGKLVLEGDVSSAAAASLHPGGVIALKNGVARAELTHVANVVDPMSQTVHVRARPLDASGLTAGNLASWEVLSGGPVLTVPSKAVVKLDGNDGVYVAVPGGFEARQVHVRSTGSGTWLVFDGLTSGDTVAIAGTAALKGMSMGLGGGDE